MGATFHGYRVSVLQTEIYAIHQAAVCLDVMAGLDTVTVYSDSKKALRAQVAVTTKFDAVIPCRKALLASAEHSSLELWWMKTQVGHSLNELADWLAKREPFLAPPTTLASHGWS